MERVTTNMVKKRAGGDSTAGLSVFQTRLDEASIDIDSIPGPTSPVTPPEGLRLGIVSCAQSGGACPFVSAAAKEAADELAWTATVFDVIAETVRGADWPPG